MSKLSKVTEPQFAASAQAEMTKIGQLQAAFIAAKTQLNDPTQADEGMKKMTDTLGQMSMEKGKVDLLITQAAAAAAAAGPTPVEVALADVQDAKTVITKLQTFDSQVHQTEHTWNPFSVGHTGSNSKAVHDMLPYESDDQPWSKHAEEVNDGLQKGLDRLIAIDTDLRSTDPDKQLAAVQDWNAERATVTSEIFKGQQMWYAFETEYAKSETEGWRDGLSEITDGAPPTVDPPPYPSDHPFADEALETAISYLPNLGVG